MAGGEFYTVMMQQTNKSLSRRLQLGKMKEKQKVKAITRYKQREVRGRYFLRAQMRRCPLGPFYWYEVRGFWTLTCSLRLGGRLCWLREVCFA